MQEVRLPGAQRRPLLEAAPSADGKLIFFRVPRYTVGALDWDLAVAPLTGATLGEARPSRPVEAGVTRRPAYGGYSFLTAQRSFTAGWSQGMRRSSGSARSKQLVTTYRSPHGTVSGR